MTRDPRFKIIADSLRVHKRNIRIHVTTSVKVDSATKEVVEKLHRLKELFEGETTRISTAALRAIQGRTIGRANTNPIQVLGGNSSDEATRDVLPKIVGVLSQPITRLQGGKKVGFGKISALDAILITIGDQPKGRQSRKDPAFKARTQTKSYAPSRNIFDKPDFGKLAKPDSISEAEMHEAGLTKVGYPRAGINHSPLNVAWRIIEFGTGIFAPVELKNTFSGTKVPGGGGAWYFNPKTKSPTILGQKGAHFLLPYRDNIIAMRGDIEAAQQAVLRELDLILAGK